MVRWRQLWVALGVILLTLGCDLRAEREYVEGTVYIVPLGGVHRVEAERAAWALARETGRRTQILERRPLPRAARNAEGRYDAGDLLDHLLFDAPVDAFRVVGITEADLAAPRYRYVIGYARHGERALIYSTARFPTDTTEATRRRWIQRILAHELGHTYGADHCDRHCLMKTTRTVNDVEHLPDGYCEVHGPLVEAGRKVNPGDPPALALMARERIRLGRWQEATEAYKSALLAKPEQPRLYVELGISLMAEGRLENANRAFEVATRLAPESPQAYYALSVLFAAGYAPWRASAYLEAAVRRDADKARAHRAAGILYQELLGDVDAASRHFERYVHIGGRDPEIVARFVYLVRPAVVTVEQPETIVAQWQPGKGLVVAALNFAEDILVPEQHLPMAPSEDPHARAAGAPEHDHEMLDFGTALSAALESARAQGRLR